MKRVILALALLVGTSVVLAGPASATTAPDVCTASVIDQPAHDVKVVDVEAVPGKDAVTKTVYVFEQKETGHLKEVDDPNWNSGPGEDKGWSLIDTKTVELEPAVPAVDEVSHTETVPATYKTVEVPCEETEEPPTFEPYEVDVCWLQANPDGDVSTYGWPQTRVTTACDTAPETCEAVNEYQHDTYWIRDKADEDYLAGLTTLNSPSDDAQLEPHDYYNNVVESDECEVPPTLITVAAPVIHQPTCDNPKVTVDFITDGEHYDGYVDYPPYSSAPDIVNVIVYAHDGYEVQGQAYWELKIDKSGLEDCGGIGTPVSATRTPQADRNLPDTGAPVGLWMIPVGIVAATAGGLILAGKRRRFDAN